MFSSRSLLCVFVCVCLSRCVSVCSRLLDLQDSDEKIKEQQHEHLHSSHALVAAAALLVALVCARVFSQSAAVSRRVKYEV